MNDIVIGGIYEHYKGKQYKVIALGRDSNTLEDVVIYEGQYDSEEFGTRPIWVRPVAEFIEQVVVGGVEQPRFAYKERV